MVKIVCALLVACAAFAQFNAEAGARSDYVFSKAAADDTLSRLYGMVQYQTDLDGVALNASARGYYGLEHPEYKDGWIDELTFGTDVGNGSFLAGKHQVNWGESDYFRVVNVINPIDLRDYFLTYIDDYKSAVKSLWMLQGQYFADTWSATFILLPDFEPLGLPKEHTGFSNDAVAYIRSLTSETPDDFRFESMGAAARLSGTIGDNDVSAYLYYGWNPTLIVTSPLRKKAFRRKMFGASITRAVDALVLRVETAYYPDEAEQLEPYGEKKEDLLKTLIATDWFEGNTMASLQLVNTCICSSHTSETAADRNVYEGSLYAETSIDNNNITFSDLILHNFNTGVGMNESKIKYRFTDALNLFVGCDLFWGDKGLLSDYEKQNRVFFNAKYFF